MYRKILDDLKDWKATSAGKTAALVVGARRVGKSYIVKKFAESAYQNYLLIDFSIVDEEVKDLFRHYGSDLDTFFELLQAYYQVTLPERQSAIIFDEVQMFPPARQMIKHLVADGRYDYIETGSLMSIKKNVQDILIPSEEREFPMYPMDFEEFLLSLDARQTYETMANFFASKKPLGQALHRKIMTMFRQYLIIGGMPQAVQTYIDTKNYREVDAVKRDILKLYHDDIYKHGSKDTMKIVQVFEHIPAQLSNANKRFMLANVNEGARLREYEDALVWLAESKIVNLCFNTTEPTVGLTTRMDVSSFKCYLGDTGLLLSQTFSEKDLMREEIYKKILFNKLEFNNGLLMENVVAQMLTAAKHDLYFYSETEDRMEIDFLLTKNQLTSRKNIIPIEVKSGKNYLANSLNKYRKKFAQQVGESFVLHDGDIKEEDGVTYLPVYMAGLL
ncbi:MAG: AAA family ATPase [Candidatus Saccharibacteria bacterium]|nr:AAA family ATPase [Candidatus Saccharibacteria bacterium]